MGVIESILWMLGLFLLIHIGLRLLERIRPELFAKSMGEPADEIPALTAGDVYQALFLVRDMLDSDEREIMETVNQLVNPWLREEVREKAESANRNDSYQHAKWVRATANADRSPLEVKSAEAAALFMRSQEALARLHPGERVVTVEPDDDGDIPVREAFALPAPDEPKGEPIYRTMEDGKQILAGYRPVND